MHFVINFKETKAYYKLRSISSDSALRILKSSVVNPLVTAPDF